MGRFKIGGKKGKRGKGNGKKAPSEQPQVKKKDGAAAVLVCGTSGRRWT